jgi:hypothetical protein
MHDLTAPFATRSPQDVCAVDQEQGARACHDQEGIVVIRGLIGANASTAGLRACPFVMGD